METLMRKLVPSLHPGEDEFENYALERLSNEETAHFEEHLLICEKCQGTLADTDEYIAMMKAAAAAYVVDHSRSSTRHGTGERRPRRNAPITAARVNETLDKTSY
jgi:hypothetical protein